MKKEHKEVNVGEVLSQIETATEGNVLEQAKPTAREKAEYEIVFADFNDFGIRKKSKRTSKILISIFSKNLLYILDEKTNKITKITNETQMVSFFNDLKAEDIIIPKDAVKYAGKDINKEDIPVLYELLNTSTSMRVLFAADMITLWDFKYFKSISKLEDMYVSNKSLLKYILSTREHDYKCNFSELYEVIFMAYQIYNISDLDTAKYYVDKRKISTIKLINYQLDNFKKYNLNVRRFIDYILFDLYRQGGSGNILRTYEDYLDMSVKYYGCVKEKYPKALRTSHDILAQKIREKTTISEFADKFEKIMDDCENFAYQTLTDKFVIKMPKVANDLVDEGYSLNHCVASYVDKVVDGDCIVVFMREKEDPETPYLTIEILPDRSVPQIEGLNKRRELTVEEQQFISKWAKARHLKLTAENVVKK